MTVAAIILAAAAPVGLVLWLIRRRSKSRARPKRPAEDRVPANDTNFEVQPAVPPAPVAADAPSDPQSPGAVVPAEEAVQTHPEVRTASVVDAPTAELETASVTGIRGIAELAKEQSVSVEGQAEVPVQPPQVEALIAAEIAGEPSEDRLPGPVSTVPSLVLEDVPVTADAEAEQSPREPVASLNGGEQFASDGITGKGLAEAAAAVEEAAEHPYEEAPQSVQAVAAVADALDTSSDGARDVAAADEAEPVIAENSVVDAAQLPGNEELLQIANDTGQSAAEAAAANDGASVVRPIPQYRPVAPRAPKPRRAAPADPSNQVPAQSREASFDIRVRLMLSRLGIRDISFLPERGSGADDGEVLVKFGASRLSLVPQEDFYEGLQFDPAGKYLSEGIELRGLLAGGRRARWLLSGRSLYVLAKHAQTSGYVSTNRLVLDRPHVVLCTEDFLPAVQNLLRISGCDGFSQLGNDDGVPSGWIAFRDVKPLQAVLQDLGDTYLNAAKPAPDIEIALEGGVCLRNQDWLDGYPPEIRLYGGAAGLKLFIDGKEAEILDDGFVAEGYDQPGPHTVHCEGVPHARTYSIVEPEESWSEWPAYEFRGAEICGPVVRPRDAGVKAVTVPMTNPLLIGAEPGQVFRCSQRNVPHWKGYVPFDVVWALPAQPLICNKKTSRIIQLGQAPVPAGASRSESAIRWSNAILNASRKGLHLEAATPEAQLLWDAYRKAARAIWRAAR